MNNKLETGMLTETEAADALDDLDLDDPEFSHLEAEMILCAFLRAEGFDEIAASFVEARIRCGWEYS
jgi:hypothetical protein